MKKINVSTRNCTVINGGTKVIIGDKCFKRDEVKIKSCNFRDKIDKARSKAEREVFRRK